MERVGQGRARRRGNADDDDDNDDLPMRGNASRRDYPNYADEKGTCVWFAHETGLVIFSHSPAHPDV
jgi:hypothetical protein